MQAGADVLITGATGQVGGALLRLFPQALAPGRAELDLADPASIRAYLERVRPRSILNPAAYTAVDRAETEAGLAFAINAEAPRVLGEEALRLGATVIHLSTDYVFDGSKPEPYAEDDATAPLGVYGASKLAGEQALAASGAAYAILRTSWVYAPGGKNFARTILRVARERGAAGEPLRIVADQHGAPTSAAELARVTAAVTAAVAAQGGHPGGVYHAAAAGETTWFGFAEELLRLARLAHPQWSLAPVLPIPASDYPTPARRPANSRLDCTRLERDLGLRMQPWKQALAEVFDELSR